MAHCEELEALTDEIKREQERASDLSIELERERGVRATCGGQQNHFSPSQFRTTVKNSCSPCLRKDKRLLKASTVHRQGRTGLHTREVHLSSSDVI